MIALTRRLDARVARTGQLSRRRRRLLLAIPAVVLALMLTVAVVAAVVPAPPHASARHGSDWLGYVFVSVLFLLGFGPHLILIVQYGMIAGIPWWRRDERQQALRDRAYRRAYHVVQVCALALLTGAFLMAYTGVQIHPQTWVSAWLIIAIIGGVLVYLPYAILLWTEPGLDDV